MVPASAACSVLVALCPFLLHQIGLSQGHPVVKRSDDPVAQAVVVEQLASKMQALEAALTAQQNALASVQGHVSKFVAFDASFHADEVSNVKAGMTAKFDDVIMNVGNGYNPVTGIFTAPVSGTYAFYIKIQTYAGHPQHLNLQDNGRNFGHAFGDDPSSLDMASTLELVHLPKGETIWVTAGTDQVFRGSGVTRFAGFLINAD